MQWDDILNIKYDAQNATGYMWYIHAFILDAHPANDQFTTDVYDWN